MSSAMSAVTQHRGRRGDHGLREAPIGGDMIIEQRRRRSVPASSIEATAARPNAWWVASCASIIRRNIRNPRRFVPARISEPGQRTSPNASRTICADDRRRVVALFGLALQPQLVCVVGIARHVARRVQPSGGCRENARMQPFLSCLAAEEAGGAGVGREGRLAAGDALGNALAARKMAQKEAKRMTALVGEREGSQFIV